MAEGVIVSWITYGEGAPSFICPVAGGPPETAARGCMSPAP